MTETLELDGGFRLLHGHVLAARLARTQPALSAAPAEAPAPELAPVQLDLGV